jgi:hypothetical protein
MNPLRGIDYEEEQRLRKALTHAEARARVAKWRKDHPEIAEAWAKCPFPTEPTKLKFPEASLAEAERVARNMRVINGARHIPNGQDMDYIANIIERLVAEVRRLQS